MLSASTPQSIWALSWSAAFLGLILLGLLRLAFPSKLKLPPGPKGWPIIGSMVELASGDPRSYRSFATLAKKYGPIMHLKLGGFNTIVVSNAKLSEELFTTRDLEFSSRPHDTTMRSTAKYIGLGEDIGFQPLSSKVRLLKRICKTELLTTAKLNATVEIRSEEVARMIRNLSTKAQDKQNKKIPREQFLEMTTNVMCRLLFGSRLYGNDLNDDNPILKKYKEVNLMFGGIDTSVAAVEWALGEVLAQPHLLARLQCEVDNVVGSQRRVAESDICNMPFLNAVIQETVRLHQSAPLLFPHRNEAQCTLADYDIPANASLFVNTWAIHRDPAVWENPTDYNPDRFLPGGANSKVKMNGSCYELLPFGTGRRMCPGMNLGMAFVQISLASIVHAFDWAFPDEQNGKVDFDDVYRIVSMIMNPLVAIPRARDALKNYL